MRISERSEGPGGLIAIVGTRPNLVKLAPLARALKRACPDLSLRIVHTGQHYDEVLSEKLSRQLGLPAPDDNLGIRSGARAARLGMMLEALDPVIAAERPRLALVFGDTDSSLAGALAASARQIPIAHIEAGLRSFDRRMPEETNRVLIDHLSHLLFATEQSALDNLAREGLPATRVRMVGNVMIDTLQHLLGEVAPAAETLSRLGCDGLARTRRLGYGVVTLHRPENVDCDDHLARLLRTLNRIATSLPLLFPVHPRTAARMAKLEIEADLEAAGLWLLPALGYLEMLSLMREARLVLTDSGGIQEETTALGVPCLTLRNNTERPVTVEQGTNVVLGTEPAEIEGAVRAVLRGDAKRGRTPDLWDGHAAERMATEILAWLDGPGPTTT